MAEIYNVVRCDGQPRGHIIFVHGLGGHPFKTWQENPKDIESLWPRWLGYDIEGISVWTMSYQAPPTNFTGNALDIQTRAQTFFKRLTLTNDLRDAPIIFVCHSLGGLIVKQLLRTCHENKDREDQDYLRLLNQVSAVVFFGTPHAGSKVATFANWFRFIVNRSQATLEMTKNNPMLRSLNDWYRNWSGRPKTLVFYETIGVSIFGSIVDRPEGDPYLPNVVAHPIERNHFDIVKPSEKDDIGFLDLKKLLSSPKVLKKTSQKYGNPIFTDELPIIHKQRIPLLPRIIRTLPIFILLIIPILIYIYQSFYLPEPEVEPANLEHTTNDPVEDRNTFAKNFPTSLRPGHTFSNFKVEHGEPTVAGYCDRKVYEIDGYELSLSVDGDTITDYEIVTNFNTGNFGKLSPKGKLTGFGINNFPETSLKEIASIYLKSEVCSPFQNFGSKGGQFGLVCSFNRHGEAGNAAQYYDLPEEIIFTYYSESGEMANEDLQLKIMAFGGKIPSTPEDAKDEDFGHDLTQDFLNVIGDTRINAVQVEPFNENRICPEDTNFYFSHIENDEATIQKLLKLDGEIIEISDIDFSFSDMETQDHVDMACNIDGRYPGKILDSTFDGKIDKTIFPLPVITYNEIDDPINLDDAFSDTDASLDADIADPKNIDCGASLRFNSLTNEELPMSSGGGGTLTLKLNKKYRLKVIGWGGRDVFDLTEIQ